MINLLITVFGIVLIILGFGSMYLGFLTPPDIRFFFIGLFSAVIGAMLLIIYGGQIGRNKTPAPVPSTPRPKTEVKGKDERITSKAIPKEIKPKPSRKVEPSAENKKPREKIKKLVTSEKPVQNEVKEPKKITPKKVAKERNKPVLKKPIEAKENVTSPPTDVKGPETPKDGPREMKPVSTIKPVQRDVKKSETAVKKPVTEKNPNKGKIKPRSVIETQPKRFANEKEDDVFVRNRLDRLKENYIQNAKDIENLIEERLDSFKGTLNQIKSESKDPSIIWSFDAGDVQETMQDTILKADAKILMMYPWVRNIEVTALKKFMETDSRMIIQEASLDDDASVELIRLLMDNNVEIRTMPHVHTVAIVTDADNGLIISTDPIYESFEVGVIYKDSKSIEEIERMFNEAWKLSKDIDLEIKQ